MALSSPISLKTSCSQELRGTDCRRGAGSKVRVAAVFCGQAVTAGNEAESEDRLSLVNVAVGIGSGPWYRVTVPPTEKLSAEMGSTVKVIGEVTPTCTIRAGLI